MKKSELIELIKETIYSELPDIISEIKVNIREELIAEDQKDNDISDGDFVEVLVKLILK